MASAMNTPQRHRSLSLRAASLILACAFAGCPLSQPSTPPGPTSAPAAPQPRPADVEFKASLETGETAFPLWASTGRRRFRLERGGKVYIGSLKGDDALLILAPPQLGQRFGQAFRIHPRAGHRLPVGPASVGRQRSYCEQRDADRQRNHPAASPRSRGLHGAPSRIPATSIRRLGEGDKPAGAYGTRGRMLHVTLQQNITME